MGFCWKGSRGLQKGAEVQEVMKVNMYISCKVAQCFYVTRGSKKRSVDLKSSFVQKNKHFMISKIEQT